MKNLKQFLIEKKNRLNTTRRGRGVLPAAQEDDVTVRLVLLIIRMVYNSEPKSLGSRPAIFLAYITDWSAQMFLNLFSVFFCF